MVTMSSRANKHFQSGRSVYVCDCCGRRTRETTVQGSDLCGECFDLAGLQNCIWDGCFTEEDEPEVKRLLNKIEKFGGDIERVKAEFKDLFVGIE